MTEAGSIWERKCRKLQDLDDQLDQEREANRENRRIIAALTSRIPELEGATEPRSDPPGAQDPIQRPWSKTYTLGNKIIVRSSADHREITLA
jgi:hypothetical protein